MKHENLNSIPATDLAAARGHPLRILERNIYRGPHLYSRRPMIRVQIDLGALEAYPSNHLPGFADALMESLPGLAAHGCSYHAAGGFERRLRDGTWLGHVAEHVALELQVQAGHHTTRGKTRSVRGRPGVYNMLYEYEDEAVGLKAGAYALRWVDQLLPATLHGLTGLAVLDRSMPTGPMDLGAAIADLASLARKGALGPTTRALVNEARRRGIPVQRLDEHSLVQLGWGRRQKRIRASITSQTSHLGVESAGDKALTKALLTQAGLPAPRGAVVIDVESAHDAARRLKFPLVTKPLDGNHGRGVSVGLRSPEDLAWGVEEALKHSRRVIVEEMLEGRDHRILVVDGKVVAVAERQPAAVVGDGEHSVAELVDLVNADPRRGRGHEQVMTRIVIDAHVRERLARHGLTPGSVPSAGQRVELRATANLSTGGTAIDRTDVIHPDNRAIAEQAASVVGLDVAGIDFLAPDITRSVRETGGGIVEVNAAPGFRMHLEPSEGAPRDVAKPVIASLFPRAAAARIPIFAITGTNGKSTTTRMVAQILRAEGLAVGCTSTSGVYLDDHLILAADASGPKSARLLLRNPRVDAAVLEVARGGILREGLGFDVCDVGAVLNVSEDHLGLKGINTIDDLAAVKSVVVESVARRGHSVLNADDPLVLRMRRHATGRPVLFSMHGGVDLSPQVAEHIQAGGMAMLFEETADGGELVWHCDGVHVRVAGVPQIPAALGGAARFNIQNALAAAAMTAAHGVPLEAIRRGLAAFQSTYEQNPGRLNVYDGHDFRVILDYAHNPASLTALAEMLGQMRGRHGRVIGMVSIPGDRRDDDIRTMGRIAAGVFDTLVFREAPDGRGRASGEVNVLLSEGALQAGAASGDVHRIIDERAAAEACLRMAQPGDLVVLLPTDVAGVWAQVKAFRSGRTDPTQRAREGGERHAR